ncbi:MAG TPA: choline ABC transporter permease subunit [Steroidobacteraceae bacterium]|nr:choline ABC transporter permease subunit [Steroidobacteraceae bacterium]
MTRNSTTSSAWPAFRRWVEQPPVRPRDPAPGLAAVAGWISVALGAVALPVDAAAAASAPEPPACHTVRLADIGWTDVTATTATLGQALKDLGYDPQITLLSVPVTYEVMRQGSIDVFLGNWMPVQTHDRQPYLDDGSIEIVRENLRGAKFSLAVPAYLYAAGLRDFSDIQRFAAALNHTIYGIEAGSVGDRHILEMIQHNAYGLGTFHLTESSEQGMLAEVGRAYAAHAPIVFLAWDPHPMNMMFDIRYLTGGDATFGPNYGGATVVTLTRAGYLAQCPNVARLLRNLQFTTRGESEMMRSILADHQPASVAAAGWIAGHPAVVQQWLLGVHTFDGRSPGSTPGGRARTSGLSARFERWLTLHKLPVGELMATGIDWVKHHGAGIFQAIGTSVGGATNAVYRALSVLPTWLVILATGLFAWWMQRSWALTAFVLVALLLIVNLGYWPQTLETLALVLVATVTAAGIGVPVGIACAHRPALAATLRPVLDLMQTLPTFVYLIPTLVLFGLGVVPALISTVIFALPAPIRLTQVGIAGVPRALVEAGEAFGATRWQMLYKIELPGAAPLILAGITQCIMLSLSMAVIAALVGAGGLGVPVVRALSSVQIGMGIEAGLAIVLLAIILDRIMRHPQPPH